MLVRRMLRRHLGTALALFVVVTAPIDAHASQCSGTTASAEDVEIDVDPATPCLIASIDSPGCGDRLAISILNECDDPLVVNADDFVCDAGPDACSPIAPGDGVRRFPVPDEDGRVDETHLVQRGDETISVHFGYREVLSSPAAEADGGCVVATGRTRGSGANVLLAVLALLGLPRVFRRSRGTGGARPPSRPA
jgi:hypothetical protein